MAISSNLDKEYYKINLAECYVDNEVVYVSYSVYNSVAEREKEKERSEQFKLFFLNISNLAAANMDNIKVMLAAKNIGIEQTATLDGKINSELYPEIAAAYNQSDKLSIDKQSIIEKIYTSLDGGKQEIKLLSDVSLLKSLGYNENWLSSPIQFSQGGILNVGNYNGEDKTAEFYYNRFKKAFESPITDC